MTRFQRRVTGWIPKVLVDPLPSARRRHEQPRSAECGIVDEPGETGQRLDELDHDRTGQIAQHRAGRRTERLGTGRAELLLAPRMLMMQGPAGNRQASVAMVAATSLVMTSSRTRCGHGRALRYCPRIRAVDGSKPTSIADSTVPMPTARSHAPCGGPPGPHPATVATAPPSRAGTSRLREVASSRWW